MFGDMYEIIALAMRYFFAGLMVLVAVRAWKITIVDSRRAAALRRMSPETGLCGEFLVVTGEGRAREGMRYPVIREGLIGSSGKADVRVRSRSVRRSHAFFELTEKGLRVRNHSHAPIYFGGRSRREVTLRDGDHITVGHVELMLVLSVPVNAPAEEKYDAFDVTGAADTPGIDLFDLNSADRAAAPRRQYKEVEPPAELRFRAPEPPPTALAGPIADAEPDDDIKIYRPRRTAPAPRDFTPERNDDFDNWLDMTEDAEWDEARPAASGWDGEWDDGPRKKSPEKRRINDDDDLFHV